MQPKKNLRLEKIAEVIHKELAVVVVRHCQDPRLKNMTITNVKVSADLSIAKIYFTMLFEMDSNIKQVLDILRKAGSFFRSHLAVKSSLRKVPELHFFYDDNTNTGERVEMLLAKLANSVQLNVD